MSTVQALLGTGRADVNARDARGTTALLQAARRQDAVAMRLLLAAGAGAAAVGSASWLSSLDAEQS